MWSVAKLRSMFQGYKPRSEVQIKQKAKDENGKPRQRRRGVTTEVENPGRLYDMPQQKGLSNNGH